MTMAHPRPLDPADHSSLVGRIGGIRGWRARLWALAGAVFYFLFSAYYAANGDPNADEGFYAYASYNAMHGKMPYRDFAYTQMPALPYLQGSIFELTGYGVRQQRWLNVCLGSAAVFVAITLWLDTGLSVAGCLVLILAWSLCPSLVYHDTIGKTYAMAQLLLVLAGSALLSGFSPIRQLVLFSICSVLAVGCRLTIAPAIMVMWICFAVAHHRRIGWLVLFGCPLILTLILFGPFFRESDNAFFWTWSYHQQSLVPFARLKLLALSFATFPAVGILGLGALVLALVRRTRLNSPAGWILAAGIIGWTVSVGVTGVYTDYAVPVLPLLLLGAGCLYAQTRSGPRQVLLGCSLVLGAAALGWLRGEHYITKGYLDSVDETVAYLKKNSATDDMILTPMPEIPLEAGRPIFPGLDLGKFALTAEMDETTANRRRILTADHLWQAVDRQEATFVVLSNFRSWNFHWTIPSLRPVRYAHYQKWVDLLMARYDCVYISPSFLIFKRHDPANPRLAINLNPPG